MGKLILRGSLVRVTSHTVLKLPALFPALFFEAFFPALFPAWLRVVLVIQFFSGVD